MNSKKALKTVGDWISKETHRRKYDILELAEASQALICLKKNIEQLNSNWISVSEGLPGDRKIVLQVTIKRLKDDYAWVQSLLWDYDKWKWWEEDDKKVDASRFKILAWRPLPEPWKGEEE